MHCRSSRLWRCARKCVWFFVFSYFFKNQFKLSPCWNISHNLIKSLWKELDKFCRIRLLYDHLSNRVRNSLIVFWFVFSLQNLLECCHISLNLSYIFVVSNLLKFLQKGSTTTTLFDQPPETVFFLCWLRHEFITEKFKGRPGHYFL